jgi:oligopeptide/dipeptide ABC transporter ATP-binding protein
MTDRESLYRQPLHPYTEALLSAIPIPDPDRPKNRQILAGEIPSPLNPPVGCHFHPRCPIAQEGICDVDVPALAAADDNGGHLAACHLRTGDHQHLNRKIYTD